MSLLLFRHKKIKNPPNMLGTYKKNETMVYSLFSTSACNGPLTRYVNLRVAHAPGMLGTFSPATDLKGNGYLAILTRIMARAWRTCRDACRNSLPAVAGKTFPAFPAHAQRAILCFWQEAHGCQSTSSEEEIGKALRPSFANRCDVCLGLTRDWGDWLHSSWCYPAIALIDMRFQHIAI